MTDRIAVLEAALQRLYDSLPRHSCRADKPDGCAVCQARAALGSGGSGESVLDQLAARIDAEYASHAGSWPNLPDYDDYRCHAEELGLRVQTICVAADSTGAYYDVLAIYPDDEHDIFGREPLAIVFTDFARSVDVTWIFRR